MADDVSLRPFEVGIVDLDDALLELVSSAESHLESAQGLEASQESSSEWDAPLDLRVMRPRAVDLMKYWSLTGRPVPEMVAAALGPNVPVLLHHVVTPFAADGGIPGRVWGLGYEISVADGVEANTVAVLPTDEVLKIATVNQTVQLGLSVGGGVGVPRDVLDILASVPALNLTGASLEASTDQKFQMSLRMDISLRKILGAPVGAGGAVWKMYRQDERLDRPHVLLQTLLVAPGTSSIPCTIRTWAKQAGWLGTRWGAKFWRYDEQKFHISLEGLSS